MTKNPMLSYLKQANEDPRKNTNKNYSAANAPFE